MDIPMDYDIPNQVEEISAETPALAMNFENFEVTYDDARPVAQKEYHVVLYIKPRCPYCVNVIKHLKKLGKTIPVKDVTDRNSQAYRELISVGHKSQVPCLFINGVAHYESAWIMKWLSDNQGKY